uniref:Uncharacterized protein n=1 Tax=Anguilla anguilla TaxID=7936 RepID=A0A0E9X6S5_ANGAN
MTNKFVDGTGLFIFTLFQQSHRLPVGGLSAYLYQAGGSVCNDPVIEINVHMLSVGKMLYCLVHSSNTGNVFLFLFFFSFFFSKSNKYFP